jgi:hypothetical protein
MTGAIVDPFGRSLALSSRGKTLAVGAAAISDGSIYIY